MLTIDFHSHILPAIDDGSRDVKTSIEMLQMSSAQRIAVMAATPHFYAMHDRVEDFLQRRNEARESLQNCLAPGMPEILLGAEVAFFKGISRADKLAALTVENTKLLLLEMPFAPWTDEDIEEVRILAENRGFTVILAHVERYFSVRVNRKKMQELVRLPVTVQINAGSLLEWKSRGNVLRMFQDGQAHVLGSDCHGVSRRSPNLLAGREVLKKKLGQDVLDEIDQTGCRLLGYKEEKDV